MIQGKGPFRKWRAIAGDRSGVTIVEFAIVAPVVLTFLMGASDVLLKAYVASLLNGEVQKAGRDSTLQANASAAAGTAVDAKVIAAVRQIVPSATYTSQRLSYSSFSAVGTPEPFTDTNGDGIRQTGECYSDVNGNGQWDADSGASGGGGASDVSLYSITVTYPHIFPVSFMGWNSNVSLTAKTLLMNQPYARQSVVTPSVICT